MSGQKIDIYQILSDVTTYGGYYFLKKLYGNFQLPQFKYLNPVQSFQGDSLILCNKFLGIPGTLLIDLTMKSSSGFESANPGLVIGRRLINSLLIYYNKVLYKIFKI